MTRRSGRSCWRREPDQAHAHSTGVARGRSQLPLSKLLVVSMVPLNMDYASCKKQKKTVYRIILATVPLAMVVILAIVNQFAGVYLAWHFTRYEFNTGTSPIGIVFRIQLRDDPVAEPDSPDFSISSGNGIAVFENRVWSVLGVEYACGDDEHGYNYVIFIRWWLPLVLSLLVPLFLVRRNGRGTQLGHELFH